MTEGTVPDNILELDDVGVVLRGNQVLRKVKLQVLHGRIHALTGPNGAGKTTLIRSIMGETPHSGTIRLRYRRDGRIGYVPQMLDFDHSVPITVFDFLFLMLRRTPIFLGRRGPIRERIRAILARTQCEQLMDRSIGRLSGGEFRRVLLAQALEPLPELLLLDEAAANIDEVGVRRFEQMLIELKEAHGISILMVSHSLEMITRVADRVTAINRTIVYDGPPEGLAYADV